MYCFQHVDKGAVRLNKIPIPGRRRGAPIAVDPRAPMIGLLEVERNLQGLMMGIPPPQRREVPLHLQRTLWGCQRMLILY
jgi:hypothetical protein